MVEGFVLVVANVDLHIEFGPEVGDSSVIGRRRLDISLKRSLIDAVELGTRSTLKLRVVHLVARFPDLLVIYIRHIVLLYICVF